VREVVNVKDSRVSEIYGVNEWKATMQSRPQDGRTEDARESVSSRRKSAAPTRRTR